MSWPKERRDRYYQENKEQLQKKAREKYWKRKTENPEALVKSAKNYRLKMLQEDPDYDRRRNLAKYRITLEEWNVMFLNQNSKCVICRDIRPRARHDQWHTDHCHDTGKIRGILCHNCNLALGAVKDSKEILLDMIKYLEK